MVAYSSHPPPIHPCPDHYRTITSIHACFTLLSLCSNIQARSSSISSPSSWSSPATPAEIVIDSFTRLRFPGETRLLLKLVSSQEAPNLATSPQARYHKRQRAGRAGPRRDVLPGRRTHAVHPSGATAHSRAAEDEGARKTRGFGEGQELGELGRLSGEAVVSQLAAVAELEPRSNR